MIASITMQKNLVKCVSNSSLVEDAMQKRAAAAAAAEALGKLRTNMLVALEKAVEEDGLDEDDAEDFLQQKYGQRLEQVAENEGMDAEDLVESLWTDVQ